LIAFYQVGYGVAAFGVGPFRELSGLGYSSAFSLGGVVALAFACVALQIIRHPRGASSPIKSGS
jgi:FHS family glucose/mannose:H+ symporter-like MFS transporter